MPERSTARVIALAKPTQRTENAMPQRKTGGRDSFVSVRCTANQKQLLEELAAHDEMTLSEFLRAIVQKAIAAGRRAGVINT